MELRRAALQWLEIRDPDTKAQAVRDWAASASAQTGDRDAADPAVLDVTAVYQPSGLLPGRPERPVLVAPKDLPQRSPFTPVGHAALLHAVAHIEFNAINLALDAVWRFPGLPPAFYRDWVRIAGEEALHFQLLRDHLQSLGWRYGDFEAHDGLWTMTAKTADDVLARMALVPRLLEARGLDATPPMQARLRQVGDHRAVEILDLILRDEVGHVAIGNHWFRELCAARGVDPLAHFRTLARQHGAPRLRPPFNWEARRRAGFVESELKELTEP